MGWTAERRVQRLLRKAEASGSCCVPATSADRQACARRAPWLYVPVPGLYVRRPHWASLSPVDRVLYLVRGLAVRHPNWVFCSLSAAVVHGLFVSYQDLVADGKIQLFVLGRAHRRTYEGCTVRFCAFRRDCRTTDDLGGVLVTDAMTTAIECACRLPFPRALAIMDPLLRVHGETCESVLRTIGGCGLDGHGIRTARRAARYADARSANGGESIARGIMIEEGFATPDLQVPVVDDIDGSEYYVDFMWRTAGGTTIYGEFDGSEKLESEEVRHGKTIAQTVRAERLRESRLTLGGAKVVRFTPDTLKDRAEFRRLLRAYGVPREGEDAAATESSL